MFLEVTEGKERQGRWSLRDMGRWSLELVRGARRRRWLWRSRWLWRGRNTVRGRESSVALLRDRRA